ncbi:ribonuclease Y [Acetatifactor muris]|jgi:ribonuclease Y|uniref:Ribonuclease Y n=1 Tax=Acetatifactor muris TaxID=879566 RepID=A0A2K4ZAG6_9FIRM|nr:ribonuclease Y [Acetatifactor muris]MCI8801360.1 ribonuclease Y [Lachnospiraceae bacterium]MCR2047558.1 ribonuclease Y [Acetatifactor muris]SOY27454.1 Ribonuclease Y [Acetatifactor muris]
MLEIIIAVAISVVLTAVVTTFVVTGYQKKSADAAIGGAQDKAREIIDEALKTAESKKRESLLEVKEESIRAKNELDKEIKERRAEVQRSERRIQQKEENIDKKTEAIERREANLTAKEESLNKVKIEISKLNEQRLQELERISGLTSEQAKDYLLKIVEDEVKHETAMIIKEMESRAKEEADKKARDYVVSAIQRCAADHVSETTISVVQLPNDEMKGRIIGREGRNIRTLETMTGVDLIIDDTPEAVILSGFDPIRREVARIALEKLIVDGRIHPARIEEMVEKAQREVEVMIKEEGEAATLEVGVHGIHPELIRLLGKMKFRTSYGQNALKHSIEVAQLSGLLAAELGLDIRIAKRAGLLHDIGKSVDHEMEGSHIQLGVELCRRYKENATVINAVESHHGDVEPTSLISCIVQAADTISAARPGARRETLETYTSRLTKLEEITNNFKGVDKSFAIQAGREVRVMVMPEQISDTDMVLLARDISKQIEAELEYPGQIKVNVIRESRVIDYAK